MASFFDQAFKLVKARLVLGESPERLGVGCVYLSVGPASQLSGEGGPRMGQGIRN